MSNIYIANGERYEVDDYNLDKFFERFPNATKLKEPKTQLQKKPKQESVNWFDQTWFGRGMKAASTTGEATDLLLEFDDVNLKTVQEFIKAKEQEASTYVPSERMQKFQEKYKKEGLSLIHI